MLSRTHIGPASRGKDLLGNATSIRKLASRRTIIGTGTKFELYIVRGTNNSGIEQAERDRSLSARSNEWVTFILELRHLPLSSAKIVVHDWDYVFWPSLFEARTMIEQDSIEQGERNLPELRWSLALKKRWADYARRVILRQIEYPDHRAMVWKRII